MKKEEGKYRVDLGLKWVNDKIVMPQLKEEELKGEIDAMMPDGFGSRKGCSVAMSHLTEYGSRGNCLDVILSAVRLSGDIRTTEHLMGW